MPDTTDPQTAFDGCNPECRKAGKHTLRWGGCEHAPKPEPTVSMSMIYKDPEDGYPSIGYDSYTVAELADLIEPALRRVHARIGPNALAMLHRGETVALSGGEYADLAREAAHAIVHRNDEQPAAPAAVPPADRAGRSERYAAAIRDTAGWVLDDGQHMIAAVMAVADAEQAELRRERDLAIAHDRQPYPTAWAYEQACKALRTHRERADELEQEVRRLRLMVDEYGAGASALTDKLKRARDMHRETCPLARGGVPPTAFRCGMCEVLDAPAVLPPAADRAALSDTDRKFLTFALDLAADQMASRGDEFDADDEDAMERLRRVADEAQQLECALCGHRTCMLGKPCGVIATEHGDLAERCGCTGGEEQQAETQAHPAEHTWAVELRDPLAEEWAPGTRYLVRDRAVDALDHARRLAPTWTDGTPTERRLVRATTTYTVEPTTPPAVVAEPGKESDAL